jgi:hypothetical protein
MPPWGDMLKPEDVEALWAYGGEVSRLPSITASSRSRAISGLTRSGRDLGEQPIARRKLIAEPPPLPVAAWPTSAPAPRLGPTRCPHNRRRMVLRAWYAGFY